MLITLDTTRADHIGCYGARTAQTPALDRLAAAGVRFERAYAPVPLTIPSHAAIMTGRLPAHLGVRSNGDRALADDAVTLAEVLRDAGWHTGAAVGAFVTSRTWGFDQGFDVFLDGGTGAGRDGNVWHGARTATAVVDDALRFVAEQPASSPLFLWVHLYDAHLPYHAPSPFSERLAGHPYDAELAYMDTEIARVVQAMADRPTLFVVAGDHGEGLGEHGEATHGLFVYDAMTRVPLLLSGWDVLPGVVSEPVSLMDVAPTVLSTLGLPPLSDVDGLAQPAPPRPLYLESWQLTQRLALAPHRALIDGDLTLIASPTPELYDVAADPTETHDLATSRPADVARLTALLVAMQVPDAGPAAPVDPAIAAQLAQLGYLQSVALAPPLEDLPDAKAHADLIAGLTAVERKTAAGDLAGALEATRGLLADYPGVSELHQRQVSLLMRLGRDGEAAHAVALARAVAPDDVSLQVADAQLRLQAGEREPAATLLLGAMEAVPYSAALRAQALYALSTVPGQEDRLLSTATALARDYPEDRAVASFLGLELARRGRLAEAAPYLAAAAQATHPLGGVCLLAGMVRQTEGDLSGARALWRRELRFYPDNAPARAALERLLTEQADWESLDALLARRALRGGDDPSVLWRRRAQVAFNRRDWRVARTRLDESLRLSDRSSATLLLDANLLRAEGREDAALARFAEARAARDRGE